MLEIIRILTWRFDVKNSKYITIGVLYKEMKCRCNTSHIYDLRGHCWWMESNNKDCQYKLVSMKTLCYFMRQIICWIPSHTLPTRCRREQYSHGSHGNIFSHCLAMQVNLKVPYYAKSTLIWDLYSQKCYNALKSLCDSSEENYITLAVITVSWYCLSQYWHYSQFWCWRITQIFNLINLNTLMHYHSWVIS